jgi:hypothetical protein
VIQALTFLRNLQTFSEGCQDPEACPLIELFSAQAAAEVVAGASVVGHAWPDAKVASLLLDVKIAALLLYCSFVGENASADDCN